MIRNNRRGEVAPVHALKAYRGSGGVGPLVLNLGTSGVAWVALPTNRFTSGNEFWDPLSRRILVPKIRSGSFEDQNPSSLTAFKLRTSARSESLCADYAIPAREGVCCRKYVNNTIPEFWHESVTRVTLHIGVEAIRT